MAITNHDRVGKALDLLRGGIAPFIEREFKSVYQASNAGSSFWGCPQLPKCRGTRPA